MVEKPVEAKDAISIYENGKSRRYSLLFAVNGGALAIAKLTAEQGGIGGLSTRVIACGMLVFNLIMIIDIFSFGFWCRYRFKEGVFGPIGWTVLGLIGFLISSSWVLVMQRHDSSAADGVVILLVALGVEAIVIYMIGNHLYKKYPEPERKKGE